MAETGANYGENAVFFDDGPDTEVYQGGPRRLWDEVEAAYYEHGQRLIVGFEA